MKEIWKDIQGYSGYRVSSLGNVSGKRVSNLKQWTNNCGYKMVTLYNIKQTTFLVHRIVALAFLKKSWLEVNHIDGVKTNNKLSNLEMVSRKANAAHASRRKLYPFGLDNHKATVTCRQTYQIREDYHNGLIMRCIATKYRISTSTVSLIINRKGRYA